jgi:hypothetical protein
VNTWFNRVKTLVFEGEAAGGGVGGGGWEGTGAGKASSDFPASSDMDWGRYITIY